MTDDQFDLDAALDDEGTPAGLRKWAEKVQKDNKRLADELSGIRKAERQNTVTGALKDLGIPEKVAAFYPGDAEASPDAVAKWLKEHEGVFAAIPANTNDEGGGGNEGAKLAAEAGIPVDMISAMRAVQETVPTSGGSTPTLADRAALVDKLKMRSTEDRQTLDAFEAELMQMARATQSHLGDQFR